MLLMGKLTFFMAMFKSYLYVYQRVRHGTRTMMDYHNGWCMGIHSTIIH